MARIRVEDRREQLIRATLAVIAEQGVTGASLRAIAAKADAPLATVHYAFASRLALFEAALAHSVQGSQNRLRALPPIAEDASVSEVVAAQLHEYLADVHDSRLRELGILELTLHALRESGLEDLPPHLYRVYYEAATEIASEISARLNIRWRIPIERVARFIIVVIDGLVQAYLATSDEALTHELVETAAQAIAGLAVDPAVPAGEREKSRSHARPRERESHRRGRAVSTPGSGE